jgi:hypothetical protein
MMSYLVVEYKVRLVSHVFSYWPWPSPPLLNRNILSPHHEVVMLLRVCESTILLSITGIYYADPLSKVSWPCDIHVAIRLLPYASRLYKTHVQRYSKEQIIALKRPHHRRLMPSAKQQTLPQHQPPARPDPSPAQRRHPWARMSRWMSTSRWHYDLR